MAKKKTYDVIVIGSGSAGFSAAVAAREVGAKVCMVEKSVLGGECPNWACVPSKALLKTAKIYQTVREARSFGITTGSVQFDFGQVMNYRNDVVTRMTGGGEYGERYEKIAKAEGIDIVHGSAEFIDEKRIDVDGVLLEGKAFVIATGSEDFIPAIRGIEDAHVLTWKNALSQKRQPKSLAIIGGGPVGCEIATFYHAFGTRVVLLTNASTILDREDTEIAEMAHEAMVASGIEIVSGAQVNEVINSRGGVYGVKAEVNGKEETYAVEQVLLATGKRANVDGLAIEEAGVKLDARGNIQTTLAQKTSAAHIWAAGDVDGGLQFTHTAHHEGVIAGRNAALTAKGKRRGFLKRDERVVPRVTFIRPEVASVGMTSVQAKVAFKKVLIGRAHTDGLGRSVTEHAGKGIVKIIAHPKTRKVLGGHIVCERAGEMIHELALAIHLGATVDKLASMIHAFPTYSEGIVVAASTATVE